MRKQQHPVPSNRVKRLSLLTFIALVASACGAPATPSRTAQILELKNEVNARQTADIDWQTASEGAQINAGGGVRTGEESKVRVDTSDGSIIRIAANTEFELLELAVKDQDPVTRLKVTAGKVWVVVAKALGQGAFEIETPSGVSTVRGSLMSVGYASDSGRAFVTCLEGACSLSNASGATDLTAGQQTEIPAANQAPQAAQPMDPTQLRDWLLNVPEANTAAQSIVAQIPPLNLSNTANASTPRVAIDGDGQVHVVWEDRSLRQLGSDYLHRQLSLEGEWSAAESLTEGFDYLYGSLTLLPDRSGQMCAFWNGATTGTDPGTIGLYRRCQTDSGWSEAEQIAGGSVTARDYSIALAPDGSVQEVHIVSVGDIYFGATELAVGSNVQPALAIDAAWVRLGG